MTSYSFKRICLIIFLFISFLSIQSEAREEDLSIPPSSETNPALRKARMAESLPHVPDIVLPYYFLKGITYPVSKFGQWIDSNPFAQKSVELVNKKHNALTVYPLLTYGDGSRFGGGFGLTDTNFLNDRYILTTRAVVYTDLDVRAELALGKRNAFQWKGKDFSFITGADWFMDGDEDYYGIGPKTSPNTFGEFDIKILRTGGALGIEVLPHFMVAPHFVYVWGRTTYRDLNTGPSVADIFPASELVGFDRSISYADLGIRLSHDTRNNFYYPEHGGMRSLTLHVMKGLNTEGYDFYKLNFNFEQYFKLPPPRTIVWLHNAWSFADAFSGSQIPFYHLPALDVFSPLRGFNRGRFRDNSMVVFNAELRYPLWQNIDGSLFVDTGRVFDKITDFSFKDFRYSVGGGVRITLHNFYIFKIEAAYGGEGMNTIFKAIQEL